MPEEKIEQNGAGPAVDYSGAVTTGYTGPHRRSKDLPESAWIHEKGSVHIRIINWIMLGLSVFVSLVLLGTIQKKESLVEQMLGAGGEELELLQALSRRQELLTCLLLLIVVLSIVSVTLLVLRPIEEFVNRIREHKMLPMEGAHELRYFAKAYNLIFEENRQRDEELRYKVEHDPLTGLYNRGAFENLRKSYEGEQIALLLIDVDKFKEVNDNYGHDMGDRMLCKVAGLLAGIFRSTDYPCRIGGDEFAVIMTDVKAGMRDVVSDKIAAVRAGLRDVSDGLPEATLSIGVAFSEQHHAGEDLFKLADGALYETKEHGRDGCTFYDAKRGTAKQ